MYIYLLYILFEISTSKLSAPKCLISILYSIVFLTASSITLSLVSSFINSAISANSIAPCIINEYEVIVLLILLLLYITIYNYFNELRGL